MSVIPATIQILHRCSWVAEKRVRSRAPFHMLWLTENAAGQYEQFDTPCHAPRDVADDAILDTLCDELRAEFAANGVVRFSVAFIGDIVDREVIGIEAHNKQGIHIGAHREIIRSAAGPRMLGALSPLERLERSRYLTLL